MHNFTYVECGIHHNCVQIIVLFKQYIETLIDIVKTNVRYVILAFVSVAVVSKLVMIVVYKNYLSRDTAWGYKIINI